MSAESASEQLPFHLQGNFAPVQEEKTALDLEVQGAIPPELRGLYLRNGPNPRSGESPHWFFGDGMVHGVALADGKAKWYRNRWVRTRPYLEGGESGDPDPTRRQRGPHGRQGKHQYHWPRRSGPGPGGELVSHRDDTGARNRRALRLRRQAHHRHDRPPEALPGDGGDALLRLRVRAALSHLPLRRTHRES